MKDKRQRMAMAWPYAVYTDPVFAASILQAAAASAGGIPSIAAAAYSPYSYYHPLHRYNPFPPPVPPSPLHRPQPYLTHRQSSPPPLLTSNTTAPSLSAELNLPNIPMLRPSFPVRAASPTHSTRSENSSPTLSPPAANNDDNCDGTPSCRCGIVNCVTGDGKNSDYCTSAPPASLIMTALKDPHAEPPKLFQPYKTDLTERA
jgi:homeobox even-skipped family protein